MPYHTVPNVHIAPAHNAELRAVVLAKLASAEVPGVVVSFHADEADLAGAFREDALSNQEALSAEDGFGDYTQRVER